MGRQGEVSNGEFMMRPQHSATWSLRQALHRSHQRGTKKSERVRLTL